MVSAATDNQEAQKVKTVKKRDKRDGFGAGYIIAFSIILALALGAFSWLQVVRYGDNVIDIFADQQDAYVQLVLDQINLVDNRDSEEIVNDILSTIDGSNSEFWTLSRDSVLIYVKDVAESNRYRGFATETYYDTSSAQTFVESMSLNKVEHAIIEIDNRKFIISGVAFEYNGNTYHMCLLTSEHVVVDSNAYLSARVNLGVAIGICLVAMMLMALFVSLRGEKWRQRTFRIEEENVELRQTIEQLNAQMYQEGFYDAHTALFDEEAAKLLVSKLIERKQIPTSFVYLAVDDEQHKRALLSEAADVFGSRLIKFRVKDNLVFAFVGLDAAATENALSALMTSSHMVRSSVVVLGQEGSSWEQLRDELLSGERVQMAASSAASVGAARVAQAAKAAKDASNEVVEPITSVSDASESSAPAPFVSPAVSEEKSKRGDEDAKERKVKKDKKDKKEKNEKKQRKKFKKRDKKKYFKLDAQGEAGKR